MKGEEDKKPFPSPNVVVKFTALHLTSPDSKASVPLSPLRHGQQVSPLRSPHTIAGHVEVREHRPVKSDLKRRLFDNHIPAIDPLPADSPRQKRLSRGASCEVLPGPRSDFEQGHGTTLLSNSHALMENYPENLMENENVETNFLKPTRSNLVRVASSPSRSTLTASYAGLGNRTKRAQSIRNTSNISLTPTLERRTPDVPEKFISDLRRSSPNMKDWKYNSTDCLSKTSTTPRRSVSMMLNSYPYEDQSCQLLTSVKKDGCHYISTQTVIGLLSQNSHPELNVLVVDCRFAYEYKGGHIEGAINVTTHEELEDLLITTTLEDSKRTVIIFHCEFSSKRGPSMCKQLRKRDRDISDYPELCYPEIYVMEGGYKKFFEEFQNQCEPQCYISMFDPAFKQECRDGMKLIEQHNPVNGSCRTKRSQSMSSMSHLIEEVQSSRLFSSSGRAPMSDLTNLPPTGRNSLKFSSSLSSVRIERSTTLFEIPTANMEDIIITLDVPESLRGDINFD